MNKDCVIWKVQKKRQKKHCPTLGTLRTCHFVLRFRTVGWLYYCSVFCGVSCGAICSFYLSCFSGDGTVTISIPTRCRVQISPKVSHKPWHSKITMLIKTVFFFLLISKNSWQIWTSKHTTLAQKHKKHKLKNWTTINYTQQQMDKYSENEFLAIQLKKLGNDWILKCYGTLPV